MLRAPTTLLAAILTVAATSRAKAEGLAPLPSHICQAPLVEEFDSTRPVSGAESWTHAFQVMMERCQTGDVLLLTRDAQTNALRYCDFDHPVQFMPTGNVVCTQTAIPCQAMRAAPRA
jgi:hypothetical protein